VLQTDLTVGVKYSATKYALFSGQVMAGPMSQPGDSGSLVLNDSDEAVGLLFAGSDQFTIFSPIGLVLDKFEVELVTSH
jgi:hypothetical protein